MPTIRGWAALGVATALAALWVGFGELEMLGTAIFLVAATAAGVGFTRIAMPEPSAVRRIFPAQVHEGDDVVVEIDLQTTRRAANLTLQDQVHGLGTARFAAARLGPGANADCPLRGALPQARRLPGRPRRRRRRRPARPL